MGFPKALGENHPLPDINRPTAAKKSRSSIENRLAKLQTVDLGLEAPLDLEVALALEQAWDIVLARTRHQETELDETVCDGETIHFSHYCEKFGHITGKVSRPFSWPESDLVLLAKVLRRYPRLDEEERKLEAQWMLERAQGLVDRLENDQ